MIDQHQDALTDLSEQINILQQQIAVLQNLLAEKQLALQDAVDEYRLLSDQQNSNGLLH